jgi:hypothetical protein
MKRTIFELIGTEYSQKFDEKLDALQELLLQSSPIDLLSVVALSSALTQTKTELELKPGSFLMGDYELVHALLLRHSLDSFAHRILLPREIQRVHDLADDVSRAFHMRRLQRLKENLDQREVSRLYVLEQARGATQVVRNWAYPPQMLRIVTALFQPLEGDIRERVGVSPVAGLQMMVSLVSRIEDRMNHHLNRLRSAMRGGTLTSMVRRYYAAFPDLEGSPEDLLDLLRRQKTGKQGAKQLLLSHACLRLVDVFTVTFDDFLQSLPEGDYESGLATLLDRWSYNFGDLAEVEPESLFLNNPIWARPLIRLPTGAYFFPNPGMLYSFCLEIMEGLIGAEAGIETTYRKRRAAYLEEEIASLVAKAFPGAKIQQGTRWTNEKGETFENDLLVVIDEYALVIEAKSGRFTSPARRGAESRMERDIRRLVVEPALQAGRFIRFLRSSDHVQNPQLRHLGVDFTKLRHFVPLTVTLEHLGTLATHWPTLRSAGFVTDEASPAPVLSVGDLELVLEILPNISTRLHYLRRRLEFEQHMNYAGDEMDLLAFYLETGFNLGADEYSQEYSLHLTGMSARRIDPYYMDREDHNTSRPAPRTTKWWQELLWRIEARRPPGWTYIGTKLLNVAPADQVRFERSFNKVKSIVSTRWKQAKHRNYVGFVTGPPERRDAFVAIAYRSRTRDDRNELIRNAAADVMESGGCTEVLAIGLDVEDAVGPYSFLGLLRRGDTARETTGSVEFEQP